MSYDEEKRRAELTAEGKLTPEQVENHLRLERIVSSKKDGDTITDDEWTEMFGPELGGALDDLSKEWEDEQ